MRYDNSFGANTRRLGASALRGGGIASSFETAEEKALANAAAEQEKAENEAEKAMDMKDKMEAAPQVPMKKKTRTDRIQLDLPLTSTKEQKWQAYKDKLAPLLDGASKSKKNCLPPKPKPIVKFIEATVQHDTLPLCAPQVKDCPFEVKDGVLVPKKPPGAAEDALGVGKAAAAEGEQEGGATLDEGEEEEAIGVPLLAFSLWASSYPPRRCRRNAASSDSATRLRAFL